MSLKCDLNPVFRRKGALLWPPLHPSPHFHPPCLGRRTKALKRLSTSSLGPHLVGRSKSTSSPLQCLHLPLPHFTLSSSVLLLICPAAWAAPPPAAITPADTCLHQHPPHGEAKRLELCGFVKRQDLCLTAECLARELVPVMQHLLIFFNAFFLCSRSLSSRWPGEQFDCTKFGSNKTTTVWKYRKTCNCKMPFFGVVKLLFLIFNTEQFFSRCL